jgi:PhzF family phenazine biosynthesis protein
MPVLQVLRVFCDGQGQFGSPLGVVLDGPAIPPERRQPLAAELGFSETVYVDDADTGQLRIFAPAAELPFAGHPLVGTAWLLSRHLTRPVTQLNPPAGPVPTWTSHDQVWIRAPIAAAPPWRLNHVADATAVDAMTEPPHPDQDADQFWAWIDQQVGTVRTRVFAARHG